MDKTLSTRQESILSFIRRYVQERSYPPTLREIGKHVGTSSTSVVNYNLNALVKKGFIERDRKVSRGLRLVVTACTWKHIYPPACASHWETGCGKVFKPKSSATPHGRGMLYCCYCGRPIKFEEVSDEAD